MSQYEHRPVDQGPDLGFYCQDCRSSWPCWPAASRLARMKTKAAAAIYERILCEEQDERRESS